MESVTSSTPVDIWVAARGMQIEKAEGHDFHEDKTSLSADVTNSILNERTGSDEVFVVHDYELLSARPLNVTVKANNETIYSGTDRAHRFGDGILIEPQQRIEIEESHTSLTIPIKVKVHATRYILKR